MVVSVGNVSIYPESLKGLFVNLNNVELRPKKRELDVFEQAQINSTLGKEEFACYFLLIL